MKPIRIAAWNVNSVRVRLPHILRYCQTQSPDILLLQETKCMNESFPLEEIEDAGYNIAIHGQKSYNGVAIMSKYKLDSVSKINFRGEDENDEARYIEASLSINAKSLIVGSIYVPNGSPVGSDRYRSKLQYYDRLRKYMCNVANQEELFFIGGDFNVAPENIDVHSPETMQNSIGFHIDERNAFNTILQSGYIDTWRHLNPENQTFSWWDYRDKNSFANDKGMRIDHILTHHNNIKYVTGSGIYEKCRVEERPSDHVPVWCDLEI